MGELEEEEQPRLQTSEASGGDQRAGMQRGQQGQQGQSQAAEIPFVFWMGEFWNSVSYH